MRMIQSRQDNQNPAGRTRWDAIAVPPKPPPLVAGLAVGARTLPMEGADGSLALPRCSGMEGL